MSTNSTQSNTSTELINPPQTSGAEDPLSAFAHALGSEASDTQSATFENFPSPLTSAETNTDFSTTPEYAPSFEENPETRTLRDLNQAVPHDVYSRQAVKDQADYQQELAAYRAKANEPRLAAIAEAAAFKTDSPANALEIERAAFIPPTETGSGKGDRSFYEALLEFAKKINERVQSLKNLASKSGKHAKDWHALTKGVHASRRQTDTSANSGV